MAGRSKSKSRNNVKCVDVSGNKIINLKLWLKKNPKKIYFDSEFERQAYLLFKKAGLKFDFQPPSRELVSKKQVLALSKGKQKKLFKSSLRPISYTSDFAIYCDDGTTVFVETKGYFHKDARMRYKLFQHSLGPKEISLLAFDNYSLKSQDRMTDIKAIIKIININFNNTESNNTINI